MNTDRSAAHRSNYSCFHSWWVWSTLIFHRSAETKTPLWTPTTASSWLSCQWCITKGIEYTTSEGWVYTFWKYKTSVGTTNSWLATPSRKMEEAIYLLSYVIIIEHVCKAANVHQMFGKVWYSNNILWYSCLVYVEIVYIFWNINYIHFTGNFQVIFHTNSRLELDWWQFWTQKVNKKKVLKGGRVWMQRNR